MTLGVPMLVRIGGLRISTRDRGD